MNTVIIMARAPLPEKSKIDLSIAAGEAAANSACDWWSVTDVDMANSVKAKGKPKVWAPQTSGIEATQTYQSDELADSCPNCAAIVLLAHLGIKEATVFGMWLLNGDDPLKVQQTAKRFGIKLNTSYKIPGEEPAPDWNHAAKREPESTKPPAKKRAGKPAGDNGS